MSSTDESVARDPVEALVEEFLDRHRRGETVVIEQFASAHPDHAATLRELLPTLVALERVKRERMSTTGLGTLRASVPAMERLGDFRIVREVGRGGMGVVFEAVQESLERRVALKVLPQASLLTPNQLERFRREARIASQLHHSNIVPVFGSGETDGYHWYAMQFIAGESLEQWRQAASRTPPSTSGAWRDRARQVAEIGRQAASALHHAHSQGTLHRDVKPGNLLVEGDDHVWVTDFGLAKALEAEGLTHSGDLLGTLQYMAPEQFAGLYDVRSEVYALGITLYELFVLRHAFAARTRSELMERIRTSPPTPLAKAAPDVPEDLAIVIERAIARDPADRYPDAQAFAADLDAFLSDRPISARRHSGPQLLLRWCRRNRGMAALAASTIVAVIGAAVTGWVAYAVAADALGREQAATAEAQNRSREKERNLELMRSTFAVFFDQLVGRDPAQAFGEEQDTGEQTVLARPVDPRDMSLLQTMLAHFDRFASENDNNQSLRLETARAHRRVGVIQARLGNLDEAAAGYDKALERFREITERDTKVEVADVLLAYGQLEHRRGRPVEAEQRLRAALELLGADATTDARSLRFRRAEAHFLLADALLAGEPGRRPPERGREALRGRGEGRQELAAASTILAGLLEQSPAEPEYLALRARCLLVGGRVRGGPGDRDGEREAERRADRTAGITIFRQLVRDHPDVDQYAIELCNALLNDRRPGPPGPDRDDEPASVVARVQEARDLAVALLERQPEFAEYKILRARCGAALGRLLLRGSAGEGGAAAARRDEAERELRLALAIGDSLGMKGDPIDLLRARVSLANLLADAGKLDAAKAEAARVVAGLRQFADARRNGRPPFLRLELFAEVEGLVRRSGPAELLKDLAELREKIPSGDRPERGGPPPSSRRR